MIKLPNINDTIVHADSLVSQHGVMLFKDEPINGYSLEFNKGVCSAVKKYTAGLESDCYGTEHLKRIIPYWKFTEDIFVGFDCLEAYYEQTFVDGVHFKEELFSGCSVEFCDGMLETVSRYKNGVLMACAIWSEIGVISGFTLGSVCIYEYEINKYGDNHAHFFYACQDASLHISFDERNEIHTDRLDRIYTRIEIKKDPFLYADEFNRDIDLGNVLSMDILISIPLVEHLYLSGCGLTEVIIRSLMNNPEWNNVKKITVDSSAISEENIIKLLTAYPKISIDYRVN